MEPWTIYIAMLAFCLAVLVLGWVFRHRTTRSCPLCDARVDLGKPRCQVCGYRFTDARY